MRILWLALLLPFTAFAQEDASEAGGEEYECTVDFAALHSFIDKSTGVTVMIPETRDEDARWLSEKVQLPSGTTVEAGHGGCVHDDFNLTFTTMPGVPPTAHPTFAQIKQSIAELPVTDARIKSIIARVQPLQSLPADGAMACGDAHCHITTKPGSFTFAYDSAF